ncbi:MAG: hypothetical protein JRM88_03850 [Nitrososphaerota archaeon]|jgi:hypothetical protein|nr:hypothetical protein [Nitrososphaerota archaeon]
MLTLHLPTGGVMLLVSVGLAVLWAVVSVPVNFAEKLVKGRQGHLRRRDGR